MNSISVALSLSVVVTVVAFIALYYVLHHVKQIVITPLPPPPPTPLHPPHPPHPPTPPIPLDIIKNILISSQLPIPYGFQCLGNFSAYVLQSQMTMWQERGFQPIVPPNVPLQGLMTIDINIIRGPTSLVKYYPMVFTFGINDYQKMQFYFGGANFSTDNDTPYNPFYFGSWNFNKVYTWVGANFVSIDDPNAVFIETATPDPTESGHVVMLIDKDCGDRNATPYSTTFT